MTTSLVQLLRSPIGPLNGPADLALLAVTVVYAASQRTAVLPPGQEVAGVNVWDHVVQMAYDPYLLLFLFLPWAMAVAARDALRWNEAAILLRAGSYVLWGRRLLRHGARRLLPIGVCWTVATVVTSAGLPLQQGWSPAASSQMSSLADVVALGVPPSVAVLVNVTMVSVTGLGLYLVICCSGLLLRLSVVYACAALVWFWTVLAFKRPTGVPLLNLADGFQFHQASLEYGSRLAAGLAALWPLLLAGLVLTSLDRRSQIRSKSTVVLAIYPVLVAGCVSVLVAADSVDSWRGVLIFTFFGSAPDGTELPRYLLSILVFLGFAYLYAVWLDSELDGHLVLVAVRRGSLLAWWWRFSRPWLIAAPAVPAAAAAAALIAGALFPNLQTTDDLVLPAPGLLAFQLIVNGTLQIWLYLLVVFLVRWLSGKPYASAVSIGVMTLLGLPPAHAHGLAASALNSLGYTLDGWEAVAPLTGRLLVLVAVGGLVTAVALSPRGSRLAERNFAT